MLLDRFKKHASSYSNISVTNFFSDRFAVGFTKKMESTQQTGTKSKFSILKKIVKYPDSDR